MQQRHTFNRSARTLLASLALLCSACAEQPANPAAAASPPAMAVSSQPPSQPAAAPQPQPALSFAEWRSQLRSEALAQGISAQTFDQAFAGITPDPSVLRADSSQPEFARPVWEYLAGATSPVRVRNGQAKLAQEQASLAAIHRQFGVDAAYLVAVWGMESSYGQFMGEQSVIRSLATLAYSGRRQQFARSQLLAALNILQRGDISAARMRGSWAGAMGQTQFIPTTYNSHAVDFDGDGRRDIWNSSADALASAAHYLGASGWQSGQPWGLEVRLEHNFDYALADPDNRRPLREWQHLGVQVSDVAGLPGDAQAALLLPAGYRGPAFLVFDNFRAILKYNNSTAYALAVGLLGDRLLGKAPLQAAWPLDEPMLGRSQRIALQQALSEQGYDPGPADGIIGANTRKAVRAFQQAQGWPADGYPTIKLLQQLQPAP
ncbi:lytic murein transglycosylase [Pseudomonas sp. N040]|uniref:lytic murein transglycosylase n=1 Tax=Pseudomonas sp. N040 TaxID=2785325 RepID=UPI0018A2EBA5|nr:lytic murein transglycosylase [Pseudomonas sp. N040]MBF7730913.1 lytic murein transglycosylase [Pseudomonas sp. N040]MBW7014556.1 lytic murein transglycosylase [Pseudomonas sp. N040]